MFLRNRRKRVIHKGPHDSFRLSTTFRVVHLMTRQLSLLQCTQCLKVETSGLPLTDGRLDTLTPAQNLPAFLIQLRPFRICNVAPFGLPLPSSASPSELSVNLAVILCTKPMLRPRSNFRDPPCCVFYSDSMVHPSFAYCITNFGGPNLLWPSLHWDIWDLSFSGSVRLSTGIKYLRSASTLDPGFFFGRMQ